MPTLGTCPVCERPIRVRTGKIVHHGYARPGRGHIVGDCYGVGHPPYEVSSDGTRAYLGKVVRPRLDMARDYLDRLERNEVEVLHAEESVPVPTTKDRRGIPRADPGWTTWWFPVHRPEAGGSSSGRWMRLYKDTLHTTHHEVRTLTSEAERCERLVVDWRPGELHEVPRAAAVPRARRPHRRLFFARQS